MTTERPSEIGFKVPAKPAAVETGRSDGIVFKLFSAMPRGWAIVLLAIAAWAALALVAFGVFRVFAGA